MLVTTDLDVFLQQEMQTWKVPAAAVAVVQDGQVIHAQAYGWRDVERGRPATTKTLFAIGSVTKSFTVAGLAALVGQGKLAWDTPVRTYLPDFRLYDPVATEHMTPRDLVTHRSGLPRHDSVWYNASLSREELFQRLRYLEPSKDFRSVFQYQNLMYMTAGYLTERISGQSWEEFVRQNLFTPLGMNQANFSVSDSQHAEDFALPYQKDEQEEVRAIPFRPLDAMGPAGSINACLEDMVPYLRLYLNGGKHGEAQVLAERDVKEMQTPQMVIPDGAPSFPEIGHQQYGMGLSITQYRGHKLVHHGGAIDGFTTLLSFLPGEKAGVMVLCNMSGTPLPPLVTYNIYDRLLGLEPVPWSARYKELEAKGKAAEEEAKQQRVSPRKPGTQPSHPLEEYAGAYEHPAYGVVTIEREGAGLKVGFHDFSSPLNHFHYDVFETPADKLNRLERMKIAFSSDLNGDISSLSIPLQPDVKDIVFTRMADRAMQDRAFLETLAGEYELGAVTITVTVREDGTLWLTLPGQPPYALAPVRGTTFDIQGLSGFRVEFRRGPDGTITEIAFFQPSGNFLAKRTPLQPSPS